MLTRSYFAPLIMDLDDMTELCGVVVAPQDLTFVTRGSHFLVDPRIGMMLTVAQDCAPDITVCGRKTQIDIPLVEWGMYAASLRIICRKDRHVRYLIRVLGCDLPLRIINAPSMRMVLVPAAPGTLSWADDAVRIPISDVQVGQVGLIASEEYLSDILDRRSRNFLGDVCVQPGVFYHLRGRPGVTRVSHPSTFFIPVCCDVCTLK